MIGPSPMCYVCEHFDLEKAKDLSIREVTCKAFPKMIPREIFFEYFDHRKPFPGDNGIQFKLKNGEEFPWYYDDKTGNKDDDENDED